MLHPVSLKGPTAVLPTVLKYLYQLQEHMHRPKTSTKKGICKAISAAKSGLEKKNKSRECCRPMCKITIAQPMQSADVIPSSCKICGMADCNSMQATKILRSAIGCSGSYGIGQLQHHGRGIWDIRPRISTVKAIQRSVL